jgi:hypothetical protein
MRMLAKSHSADECFHRMALIRGAEICSSATAPTRCACTILRHPDVIGSDMRNSLLSLGFSWGGFLGPAAPPAFVYEGMIPVKPDTSSQLLTPQFANWLFAIVKTVVIWVGPLVVAVLPFIKELARKASEDATGGWIEFAKRLASRAVLLRPLSRSRFG